MEHIVFYSGGLTSWEAARRVREKEGDVTLLFADTKMEDEDLYRFLHEGAEAIGATLEMVADGRDVWQVFHDKRFLGNSRIDPCSEILKRNLMRKWVISRYEPSECTLYVGLDWTEPHRVETIQERYRPYDVQAPLTERPLVTKKDIMATLTAIGIAPPRLYEMGFPHNNCGGFCVKAGQAHFKRLLQVMPERYAYHEEKERELRDYLGKDVSILKDRRGGKFKTLTLKEFRESLQKGEACDELEWGGCGCVA